MRLAVCRGGQSVGAAPANLARAARRRSSGQCVGSDASACDSRHCSGGDQTRIVRLVVAAGNVSAVMPRRATHDAVGGASQLGSCGSTPMQRAIQSCYRSSGKCVALTAWRAVYNVAKQLQTLWGWCCPKRDGSAPWHPAALRCHSHCPRPPPWRPLAHTSSVDLLVAP